MEPVDDNTGASPGSTVCRCGVDTTAGLTGTGSATEGSAGKELGARSAAAAHGSVAASSSTTKGSGRLRDAAARRVVFHGLSTSTEGIPSSPAARGEVETATAQGFANPEPAPAGPFEPENVLGLTACATRGGSNRENGDGDAPQSCNSPLAGRALELRVRDVSRAVVPVPYASCTAENAAPAPDERRSHLERIPPLAEPNKSVVGGGRMGRGPGEVRGLGTRTGTGDITGVEAGAGDEDSKTGGGEDVPREGGPDCDSEIETSGRERSSSMLSARPDVNAGRGAGTTVKRPFISSSLRP